MITKPTTKFALVDTQDVVVDGATEIDVTNDVGSWKELEIEQCREDTSGVISEVSFPITFHFAAKELLEKLFGTGSKSRASTTIWPSISAPGKVRNTTSR